MKLDWFTDLRIANTLILFENGRGSGMDFSLDIENEGNMGQNHNCKESIQGYRMKLYQGNNYFMRSFHDKIYIVSMGKNINAQGRLPFLQCISFQSLLY